MKKILITGGTGFIGKSLVNKLLQNKKNYLVIVDNLVSSAIPKDLIDNPRITFFKADLSDWDPPSDHRYDYIYHLAAPVGPVRVLEYAGRMSGIISSHVEKMAHIASKMDAKLMFISTSELYGYNADKATPEDVNKIVPSKISVRLEYAVAKLMGEIVLKNLSTVMPLKYNIVRPFNIVGPHQNKDGGFVIPRFIDKAMNNEDITVYGDGKMIRTFTHVDDFTDAIKAITESEISGEIFNIGNPENSMSILELAKKVKVATSSDSNISLVNPKELFGDKFEEAWDKIPDISKIKKMISWQPKWGIDEILKEVIEIHDKNKQKVKAGIPFIITVDTEADNQKNLNEKMSIDNLFYLPRFQTLCENYGFIPTYLITQEVVENDQIMELLKEWQVQGKAEIGTHLHPWTTSPIDPKKDKYLRYPSELSKEDLYAKLKYLTDLITSKVGKRPLVYRAGRWGFDKRHIPILKNLGYIADCSITPKVSWRNMPGSPGNYGPDFSNFTSKPYYLDKEKRLLEVPMTIVYTGLIRSDNNFISKIFNSLPESFIKSVINKLFFGKKWLRVFPNSKDSDWSKIFNIVQENKTGVLEFMIHSSELSLGASKQTKTEESVAFTFDRLEALFSYLHSKDVDSMSLGEYAREYQSKNL